MTPATTHHPQTIVLRTDKRSEYSKVDVLKVLTLSGVLMYAQEKVTYGTLNQHWESWVTAGQPRQYLQLPHDKFHRFQKSLSRFPHTIIEIGKEVALALPPAEDTAHLAGLKSAKVLTAPTSDHAGAELFPPSASNCPNVIVELESKESVAALADKGSHQMMNWIEGLTSEQLTRWYDTGAQLALFGLNNPSDYHQLYFHAGVRDPAAAGALVKGAFVIPPRELPTIREIRQPVISGAVDFRDFIASKNQQPRSRSTHRTRA